MACSRLLTRYCLLGTGGGGNYPPNRTAGWRNPQRSIHHQNSSGNIFSKITTPANLLRKCKDSVLLIEATKGVAAKMAIGICQAGASAGLVYGTGYAMHLLTRDPDHISQKNIPVPASPVDTNHSDVDSNAVALYLEERRRLVENKINVTYFHMMSGLACAGWTSILSFRVFKNKSFLTQISSTRPLVAVGAGVITPFLMGTLVRSLPQTKDPDGKRIPFGMKELGHLMYSGTLGLVAAPLYLLGGQSMIRAFYVTAGCMAGFHGLTKVIPKDSLLHWEKPLMLAINAILVSFLMTLVFRPGHYAFTPLYRFMMHGGLLVYSASYVHSLQKMEQMAKMRHYDPVNAAMTLSMNLLNIFARLAFMLPPYFQVCRDHTLIMPSKQRLSPSSLSTKSNKPGTGGGGDSGSGSGNEM